MTPTPASAHPAPRGLRRMRRSALAGAVLLAALAVLGGSCTLHPTPYQPLGEAGGYEEARLGERVFRVSFRGNRATPETTVLDFLFLRSAELTRQSGYTHFTIQEDFGRTQLSLRAAPRSSLGLGMGFGGSRSFWAMGFSAPLGEPDVQAVVSYHLAVFVIHMLPAPEAAQAQGQVYEADYLLRSLEAKKAASLREGS